MHILQQHVGDSHDNRMIKQSPRVLLYSSARRTTTIKKSLCPGLTASLVQIRSFLNMFHNLFLTHVQFYHSNSGVKPNKELVFFGETPQTPNALSGSSLSPKISSQSQFCLVVVIFVFSGRVSESVWIASKWCCAFRLKFLPSYFSLHSRTSVCWTRRGHASNFFGFPVATGTASESPPKPSGPGAGGRAGRQAGGGAKCQRVLRLRLICTFHTCACFYFLPFVS